MEHSNKFNGSMMNLTVLQLCSLLFVHFYIFKCVYIQYFHLNFAQMFIEVSKTNLKVFLLFCSSLLKDIDPATFAKKHNLFAHTIVRF